jgi:hypothetical protein
VQGANHECDACQRPHSVDITSSDFPNYDRNHNTAADPNADAQLVVAEQTIFHGGTTASRLILPVISGPLATATMERGQ